MAVGVIYKHEVVEYYMKEIILSLWTIQKRSIHNYILLSHLL